MRPPPETITATRVILRRATPADARFLFQTAQDPEVMRLMAWPIPSDLSETQTNLQKTFADWETGSEYQWLILERKTGDRVGTISCRPRDDEVAFGWLL